VNPEETTQPPSSGEPENPVSQGSENPAFPGVGEAHELRQNQAPTRPSKGITPEPQIKKWHYFLGFSSLIPIWGLPSALVSLVLGLQMFRQKGRRLILLALLGFTVTGWYSRSYFELNAGTNSPAEKQVQAVQKDLYRLIQEVEATRRETGRLPETLWNLKTTNANIFDLRSSPDQEARPFYYARLSDGRSYYLFSRGADGEAFTADDILPVLTNEERVQWGYRVRPSDFSSGQSSSPTPRPQAEDAQALVFIRWRDPEDGFLEAKRTGRPLLLDFTAEWCGWCRRLEADVLSKPEVARYVNQHYVPVKVLDRMNEEHKNSKLVSDLQAKFQVRGFPTLAVTSLDLQRSSVQRGYIGDPSRMLSFFSNFSDR